MMTRILVLALLASAAVPAAAQSNAPDVASGQRLAPSSADTPQVKAAIDRAANCIFYSVEGHALRVAAEEAVTRPAGRPGSAEWSAALKSYQPYLLARRTQRRCIEALDQLRFRGIDNPDLSVTTVTTRDRQALLTEETNLLLEWMRYSDLDQAILWRLAGEPDDDRPEPLPFYLLAPRAPGAP